MSTRWLTRTLLLVWFIAGMVLIGSLLLFHYYGICYDGHSPPDQLSVPPSASNGLAPPANDSSDGAAGLTFVFGMVTVLALIVAWRQLSIERNGAGGQGMHVLLKHGVSQRSDHSQITVAGRMVGPFVWYDVDFRLERHGTRFDVSTAPPTFRTSMDCDDDPISWTFDLPTLEIGSVWLIVTWVQARGQNLRTEASAWRLGQPPDTYLWKYHMGADRLFRLQGWSGAKAPSWFRDWICKPRPTGRWKKEPASLDPVGAMPAQGPVELRRAPDAT